MRLSPVIVCGALVPQLLAAHVAAENPQALVAKYADILKNYPQRVKLAQQQKALLPQDESIVGISFRLSHEPRPEIRQILLVARHFMLEAMAPDYNKLDEEAATFIGTTTTSLGLEMAGQIAPDSPALELVALYRPTALGFIAWHNSGGGFVDQPEDETADKAFKYFDKIFDTHPSRMVKSLALVSAMELASRPRLIDVVERYLARLEAFNPGDPAIAQYKQWLVRAKQEAAAAPQIGQFLPSFSLPSLDQPGKVITPASFKGKYLLLDFWATWCSPCMNELPFTHKAYAKYHSAGLEILSVSWDRKAEDIAKFRKHPATPMPWHHTFPQGTVAKELNLAFQVQGIPYILLVGPDGRILETVESLRGEKLEETLGKYMKPEK